jgi:hypothetical protein
MWLQNAHYDHGDSTDEIEKMKIVHQCRKRAAEEDFHALQYGAAISCLAFSCLALWSPIFMSRIFMPCNMVPQFHVSQFHVSHFQRPLHFTGVVEHFEHLL